MNAEMKRQIEDYYREVYKCNHCFATLDLPIRRTPQDLPQLRWIGPDYARSKFRIVIALVNPGSAGSGFDGKLNGELDLLGRGESSLDRLMSYLKDAMPNWKCSHNGNYNYETFHTRYLQMGLRLDQLAFVNIALCNAIDEKSNENKVDERMLKACVDKHSMKLLTLLRPDIVLLGGSTVSKAKFREKIRSACPRHTETIEIPHYSFRSKDRAAAHEKINSAIKQLLAITKAWSAEGDFRAGG